MPDLSIFTGRRALDVFATEPGPWSGLDPRAVLDEVLAHVPDEDPAPVAGARELILAARAAGMPTAIVTSAGPAVGGALARLAAARPRQRRPRGHRARRRRRQARPGGLRPRLRAPGCRSRPRAWRRRTRPRGCARRAPPAYDGWRASRRPTAPTSSLAAGATEVHDDARPLVRPGPRHRRDPPDRPPRAGGGRGRVAGVPHGDPHLPDLEPRQPQRGRAGPEGQRPRPLADGDDHGAARRGRAPHDGHRHRGGACRPWPSWAPSRSWCWPRRRAPRVARSAPRRRQRGWPSTAGSATVTVRTDEVEPAYAAVSLGTNVAR